MFVHTHTHTHTHTGREREEGTEREREEGEGGEREMGTSRRNKGNVELGADVTRPTPHTLQAKPYTQTLNPKPTPMLSSSMSDAAHRHRDTETHRSGAMQQDTQTSVMRIHASSACGYGKLHGDGSMLMCMCGVGNKSVRPLSLCCTAGDLGSALHSNASVQQVCIHVCLRAKRGRAQQGAH